jgi:hypothetical protein
MDKDKLTLEDLLYQFGDTYLQISGSPDDVDLIEKEHEKLVFQFETAIQKLYEPLSEEELTELIYRLYVSKCESTLKDIDEIENKRLALNPPITATEISYLSKSEEMKHRLHQLGGELAHAIYEAGQKKSK